MKNKIISILCISIMFFSLFINNTILAAENQKTITATVTTSNPNKGQEMTFILPNNVNVNGLHLFVCWSGTFKSRALYIAKEWTDDTVFMLSSDYKYLYAYDTKLKYYYDFDIYTYDSSGVPTYNSTQSYLNWNGLIYENNGLPNIYITTDDVYFNSMSLANVASSNISFFPMTLLETTQQLVETQTPVVAMKTIQAMKTILLCGVGCLALLISLPLLLKVFSRYRQ